MKTEHTPAPWHVEQRGSIHAKNEFIGIALDGRPWGKKLPQEANARLMAAAPELFEFAESLANFEIPSGYSPYKALYVLRGAISDARALLAKIEGDESNT